jgi:acetyl-CoA C-acetyltransferase
VNVAILGTGIVPFMKTERPLVELGRDAARRALADAGLEYTDVGELFATSSLAPPQHALAVAQGLGHTGVPITAIESASAGGLVALREAAWAVASGRCDVALAIGYEKTTALEPGGIVPRPVGVWDHVPPAAPYAIQATRWIADGFGSVEALAAIAAKNWNQARRNPDAARRVDHEVTIEEVLDSRMVATPLTRMMCHASVDGAAAVILAREDTQEACPRLLACELTSLQHDPKWPLEGPAIGSPAQTARTAALAFEAAEMKPSDVDVALVHDLCVVEEPITLVSLGLAPESQIAEMALAGELAPGGTLPTNTDGGCLARGHPFAATGLAQTVEAVRQLRGVAQDRQVRNAQTALVHAAGGGGSCAVALLVG